MQTQVEGRSQNDRFLPLLLARSWIFPQKPHRQTGARVWANSPEGDVLLFALQFVCCRRSAHKAPSLGARAFAMGAQSVRTARSACGRHSRGV